MQPKKQKSKTKSRETCYNKLPIKLSQNEFNTFIKPCLSRGKRGPQPKVSYYKIFNYILYVLHTGIQWDQLLTCRGEIHWSNVYRHHNRWSKDGSYRRIFENSVEVLDKLGKLDLSTLYGDGSNVVAKKGEKKSDTPDTNIKKARKH
jgi:hypothetical protein